MFPHWIPSTEADLKRACDERSLHENHYWDAKKQIDKTDKAKAGIAKDIAAFAVDGGLIVIGLDEVTEDTFVLSPVPLINYPGRVAEIAASRIEPAVETVRCEVLPSGDDPLMGYVFVLVEPSLSAPHRVDDIYYYRGDKKNEVMSDAQVERLIARRRSQGDDTRLLLARETHRDPMRRADRDEPFPQLWGHGYFVAEPVAANPRQAVALHNDGQMQEFLSLLPRATDIPGLRGEDLNMPPDGYLPHRRERRADGWALTCDFLWRTGRRAIAHDQPDLHLLEIQLGDIEFLRGGGIRAVFGRACLFDLDEPLNRRGIYIDMGYLLRYVHRLVAMTAAYGQKISYTHGWNLGIHITSLQGRSATTPSAIARTRWSDDHYQEVTRVSSRQLEREPWVVVDLLMERLVNGLGCYPEWQHLLVAPPE